MTKDEALKMAIEFIHKSQFESVANYYVNRDKTIQACKEALEQPKEPQYLYVSKCDNGKPELSFIDHQESIGKIKLEVNND